MIRGIDHVVLLAGDLGTAASRFESAGFEVIPGGRHPAWGTENALIPLADGSYLELLAVRDSRLGARHRLWVGPDGRSRDAGEYGGFALESDDLNTDCGRIAGCNPTPPEPGERHRPDGSVVRWRLAFTDNPELPFLIQDVTPRTLRIPAATAKWNARVALAGVVVVAADLGSLTDLYGALLVAPPSPLAGGCVEFATGRGRVVLRPLEASRRDGGLGLVAIGLTVSGDRDAPDLTGIAGRAVVRAVREGDDAWTSC